MTVGELIELLEDCYQDAEVTDVDGNEIIKVEDLGDTVEIIS